jgi:hypothetical protein
MQMFFKRKEDCQADNKIRGIKTLPGWEGLR